jgi:hypothetical protein
VLDPIDCAKGKLDEPDVMRWALRRWIDEVHALAVQASRRVGRAHPRRRQERSPRD